MSAEDELTQAVSAAFKAYETARYELFGVLGPVSPDELDEVVSMAEEFGARYSRARIEATPDAYGIDAERVASKELADQVELRLGAYIEANYNLDGAVAELEQHYAEHGRPSHERTIAFHGEFPVVDLQNMTVTFPGRRPEPLVLQEGSGPDEPERGRPRDRGRGR
jgi:hypothetical protein